MVEIYGLMNQHNHVTSHFSSKTTEHMETESTMSTEEYNPLKKEFMVEFDDSNTYLILNKDGIRVRVMMFNATFNNISVMSWRSVLLLEKTTDTSPERDSN